MAGFPPPPPPLSNAPTPPPPRPRKCPLRPSRLKRSHTVLAAIDESLLVEHAVGGQEDFAMDVTDFRTPVAQRHVERGVVNVVLKALIESHGDVDMGAVVGRSEVAGERARSYGELLDPAFDEVSRCRRFGKDDEFWLGIELGGLRDDGADAGDVRRVLTFGGAELGKGDPNIRH